MITVKLHGGIGNNLFQIAAATMLAKIHNTNASCLMCKITRIETPMLLEKLKMNGIYKTNTEECNKFTETKFNFDENFFTLPNNTHLDGYFQSQKYFIDIKKEIKDIFSFKKDIYIETKKINKDIYNDIIKGENSTGLHVRRSDYLLHKNVYAKLDVEYYQRCLSKIKNKKQVYIFSDDIKWCRSNFIGSEYVFVKHPPIHSLLLMSNCDNLIIANSTFSWWGAWLGKEKNVFCPNRWFCEDWPHKEVHETIADCTKDMIPESWDIC